MIERVRRIVTGEPEPGKSVFTHVEEVDDPVVFGQDKLYGVWGYDTTPDLPFHTTEPFKFTSMLPGNGGGLRVNVMVKPSKDYVLPPDVEQSEEYKTAMSRRDKLMRAMPHGHKRGRELEPSAPAGMHRTDTIDIGVIVTGKIGIMNMDGSEEVLEPGDVYIQNGAMHSWRGLDDEPSMIVFIVVPANRVRD
jgi:hypothetical protein